MSPSGGAVSEALAKHSGNLFRRFLRGGDQRRGARRAGPPRRPVVYRARAITATPAPVMIHQPGRVALANPGGSGPCRFAASTEPMTATPSKGPTCRLVDAIPAATPACDLGIPATALLVIGAFTSPADAEHQAASTT